MGAEGVVLVIDDDEAIRQLVQSVLEDEGHRVVAVGDVSAGLEALDATDVRLVLLDLVLQGESGTDFLEQYDRRGHAGVPVVMLSGWDAPTELPPGVAGHIPKPFDLDEFVRLVQEHLTPA